MSRWRRLRPIMIGLVLMVVVGVGVSAAAAQPSPLVPGNGLVAGRGYGDWVAAGVQWRLSQRNHLSIGASCRTSRQHGPVWFLRANVVKASVLTCAIPAGRYVLNFAVEAECFGVEPGLSKVTNAALIRCARNRWRRDPWSETLTLDGVNLQPTGYVGGTPAFSCKMPAHDNYAGAAGRTHGRAAVYGIASLLRPLSPGTHTLVEQAVDLRHPSSGWILTWHLTVG
jgi:hypothetical protein